MCVASVLCSSAGSSSTGSSSAGSTGATVGSGGCVSTIFQTSTTASVYWRARRARSETSAISTSPYITISASFTSTITVGFRCSCSTGGPVYIPMCAERRSRPLGGHRPHQRKLTCDLSAFLLLTSWGSTLL